MSLKRRKLVTSGKKITHFAFVRSSNIKSKNTLNGRQGQQCGALFWWIYMALKVWHALKVRASLISYYRQTLCQLSTWLTRCFGFDWSAAVAGQKYHFRTRARKPFLKFSLHHKCQLPTRCLAHQIQPLSDNEKLQTMWVNTIRNVLTKSQAYIRRM